MEVGSSVSRRTRSRLDAYYRNLHDSNNNSGRRRKNQEKVQDSVIESVDDDDDEVITWDDSDGDVEEKKRENVVKKGPRKVGRPAEKRKRARLGVGVAEIDFATFFKTSSTWKDKDLVRESSVDVRESSTISTMPLKFKFKEDEKSCVKKSEWEMEMDSLFHDLEIGLWESQTGPPPESCVTDDECTSQTDVDEYPAARCSRGEHDPFLDEQIGMKCRFCNAILLDIRYVLPPFHVEESPDKGGCNNKSEEVKIPHQIQFKDPDCGTLESTTIPCTGTVFDLIPSSDKQLHQHQLEGFEFMWRNLAGDININNLQILTSGGGRGCIISHAPGTGKTRLTIVFLHTFMALYPTCRPVIIAPRGVLLSWEHELRKWKAGIDFHNLNETKLSDQETAVAAGFTDDQTAHHKSIDYSRFVKLLSWMKGGSILGVGYRLFEELGLENDKFKKVLLESPSLLVLDEGHTPRNDQSLMWKVLTKVVTKRRIILSGTPFQNNFDELYNTLSLVNPRFYQMIRSTERRGRRRSNAARDEWTSLANSITKNSSNDEGIKKLRSLIQPFVHIHKGSILNQTLPGLRDCRIILKATELQKELLHHNAARVNNSLKQAHLASLISIHPSLVAEKPEFTNHKTKLKGLRSDPNAGVKTDFIIKLIQLSSQIDEKVLIFSEFIEPLLHLKKLLKSHLGYNEGRQVMYIDGELNMKHRQSLITSFNEKNGEAKVLLASQRACCEGISLVGASRVVLLDVSWNPSVERQAICRAYRLGQEKVVYVYHLVTSMEIKKCARQMEKDRISELIFCSRGGGEKRDSCDEDVCEDKVLEAMVEQQGGSSSMFERIVYQHKESDLMKDFGLMDLDS